MELRSKYYLPLEDNLKKYGIPEEAAGKAKDAVQEPEEALLKLLSFLIT